MTPEEQIYKIYEQKCQKRYWEGDSLDIYEHLPTLKEYADKCESVLELGLRGIVSTWAFLASKATSITSIDIRHPSEFRTSHSLEFTENLAKDVNKDFKFIMGDSLKLKINKSIDLTFIDTLHQYEQLRQELEIVKDKTNKYIICHDTEIFGYADYYYGAESPHAPGGPGLMKAIYEFIEKNPQWIIEKIYTNNNGLLILAKI